MAELQEHMCEVIAMLLEDGEPVLESEFVGTLIVSPVLKPYRVVRASETSHNPTQLNFRFRGQP